VNSSSPRRWAVRSGKRTGSGQSARREAKATIRRPDLRVHDLRHTAASVWLASGADPKVVQRVLGHATAAMTMDLCGPAARGHHGARPDAGPDDEDGASAKVIVD
jgi:integrase